MQNRNVIPVIRQITIIQLTLIIGHRVFLFLANNVILLPLAGNQLPTLSMMFSFFQFIREVIKENGPFAPNVIQIRLIIRYLIARDVMPTSIRVKTILMNSAMPAIQEEEAIEKNQERSSSCWILLGNSKYAIKHELPKVLKYC